MKKRIKKRWLMIVAIVLLLAYCNRATLNPFAPDGKTEPQAEGCQKAWSSPGFEL